MYQHVKAQLVQTLEEISRAGLLKNERAIESSQGPHIRFNGKELFNFCSNNYLGLSSDPRLIQSSQEALETFGFGMSSVRFICGTQTIHLELESQLSQLLKKEATILFPSCFDANGAIFEVLLTEADAVISDELNHASIIDGIRLSKAVRYRYRNRDMQDLEQQLSQSSSSRRRLIVTDGVFSMDGSFAPLQDICDLAERYDALVMVDDSHAVGFIGQSGAGTPELFGVSDRVDIISGTLGKALGGASGGYISAHKEIVDLLRQRARPYLFSNALAPSIVAASLTALELVEQGNELRERLGRNAFHFRSHMSEAGFTLLPGEHPIVPVMFDDEHQAQQMAEIMLHLGVYVVAFSYPVVPLGRARIRVQLSAAHSPQDIELCIAAFVQAREILHAG
ncbi:MAG: glycine C-acetyltransferase [Actinomycetes bacterium]|jgi:glycine C-acetyltransferase